MIARGQRFARLLFLLVSEQIGGYAAFTTTEVRVVRAEFSITVVHGCVTRRRSVAFQRWPAPGQPGGSGTTRFFRAKRKRAVEKLVFYQPAHAQLSNSKALSRARSTRETDTASIFASDFGRLTFSARAEATAVHREASEREKKVTQTTQTIKQTGYPCVKKTRRKGSGGGLPFMFPRHGVPFFVFFHPHAHTYLCSNPIPMCLVGTVRTSEHNRVRIRRDRTDSTLPRYLKTLFLYLD